MTYWKNLNIFIKDLVRQFRIQLIKAIENKITQVYLRMRDEQLFGVNDRVTEKKQVEIDCPGRPFLFSFSAEGVFDAD